MLNSRLDLLTDYPFQRLRDLLSDVTPGGDPVIMSIGEPQHAPPPFVAEILARESRGWGKYPPMEGTPDFRAAAASWAARRFSAPFIDPDQNLLPLSGTREGLFQIGMLAAGGEGRGDKKLVLLPNPFYQVYAAAAVMAGAEPVYVTDFDAVPRDVLSRTALAYLCNPSNPQGNVASADQLDRLVTLAREHDFLLVADECYSEIYRRDPPTGILESCARLGDGLKNVAAFHSLSKRSSVPGLRSGFVIAEGRVIAPLNRLRSYCSASMPLPVLAASAALWRDEEHVVKNRDLYNAKVDLADKLLGQLPGYHPPEGGFFLWLDVGDGEAFTKALWRRAGVKLLPGAYLARPDKDGLNPGAAYARVALVHDLAVTERALVALRDLLASLEAAAQ